MWMRTIFVGGLLLVPWEFQGVLEADEVADGTRPSAEEVFEQRIMPIFRSANPSSCIQCHLSAVDLKDYILPSHEATFLSLRDQGMIDLQHPEESKILQLIAMGNDDSDKRAERIHRRMREAEAAAFTEWILECCADERLVGLPVLDTKAVAKPPADEQVIRHARKSRVVDSFKRNVWSQRMRCFPCHTPHEIQLDNPMHRKPQSRYEEFVQKYGRRMDIFRESPEATLQHLIESSRKTHAGQLPLIHLQMPEKSLLVLKPTAKVPAKLANGEFERPSSDIPVTHMGGLKMHVHDQSYKAFVAWLSDYADLVGRRYKSVQDLPMDNWIPTQHIVRLKSVPEKWENLRGVQMFLYSYDAATKQWAAEPTAFAQGLVTPRKFVNGSLTVLANDGDSVAAANADGLARLEGGRFRMRVYYDANSRLDGNPLVMLNQEFDSGETAGGAEEFVGEVEFNAEWKTGFRNALVLDAGQLK